MILRNLNPPRLCNGTRLSPCIGWRTCKQSGTQLGTYNPIAPELRDTRNTGITSREVDNDLPSLGAPLWLRAIIYERILFRIYFVTYPVLAVFNRFLKALRKKKFWETNGHAGHHGRAGHRRSWTLTIPAKLPMSFRPLGYECNIIWWKAKWDDGDNKEPLELTFTERNEIAEHSDLSVPKVVTVLVKMVIRNPPPEMDQPKREVPAELLRIRTIRKFRAEDRLAVSNYRAPRTINLKRTKVCTNVPLSVPGMFLSIKLNRFKR
ncbi:hypothetical protein EVAR_7098_1 [Eumeta japonica]|uniref:Uncharacterized protein n=1 Tax=Eumeta variegata TaxID=151549 RepID=A0A4C1YCR5_EUMVA|nr:hypothetical protein EVAR_7098_1 [Eumeta japonica]